jgi:cAMP phosphodiesterase
LFAAVFPVCLPLGNGSAHAAPQAISNDKELNVALKNAKTSDDHRRIAAYYEEKAQELQQKEKEEQELADYFATHPSMYGKIYPTPYQNHKGLADYYHCAAGIALQRAKEHQHAAESLSPASH